MLETMKEVINVVIKPAGSILRQGAVLQHHFLELQSTCLVSVRQKKYRIRLLKEEEEKKKRTKKTKFKLYIGVI